MIVYLVFSHHGFWSGDLFLIAPFPDRCLFVPLYVSGLKYIYEMTKDVESELRLDMVKSTEEKGHTTYQSFSISGPSNYSLHIGTYSGTAGNNDHEVI